MTDRWWLSRRAGSRVIGSQSSAPSSGKRNSAGITPAIRRETPSSTIVPPTAPGSAPNRLRHRPSLSTATGSAPAASSPSAIVRPAAGGAPSTVHSDGVVSTALTCAGSPRPVSAAVRSVYAPVSASRRVAAR